MKTKIPLLLLIVAVIFLFYWLVTIVSKPPQNKIIVVHDTVYIDNSDQPKSSLKNLTIKSFKQLIGLSESNNNYRAVSENCTYFGKYQISSTNIDFFDYDVDYFIENPDVQEYVMDDLIYEYLFQSASYINKYSGSKFFELDIDMWTILYANHCVGYTNTKNWLDKPSKNKLYRQLINFNINRNKKTT